MPVAFYIDEQVNDAITHGLARRGVDVLRVQDDGHGNTDDSIILDRAAALGRVVFTQDTDFLLIAHHRQANGIRFAGVVYAAQLLPIGVCVYDLEMVGLLDDLTVWEDRLQHLPIR